MSSTFQAAGDALALSRGQVPDRAADQKRQQAALRQLEQEDQESYFAFREYCFSGPRRDLKSVGEIMGRSPAWVCERKKRFLWDERVAEFDQASANLASLAYQAEVDRMAKRQARLGRTMQAKAIGLVRNIDVRGNHKISEIGSFTKAAVEIERTAMGAANKREERLVLVATFQEAANKRVEKQVDPQDAGAEPSQDQIIDLRSENGDPFAPVKDDGEE